MNGWKPRKFACPDYFDKDNETLDSLDRMILKANQDLLMIQKHINFKRDTYGKRIDELTGKRDELLHQLSNHRPVFNNKMKEIITNQKVEMEQAKTSFQKQRSQISRLLEKQIRYQRSSWAIQSDYIFDHMDSFLLLLKYSHAKVPNKDVDPYCFIARSIDTNIHIVERIKFQLNSSNYEYQSTIDNIEQEYKELTIEKRRVERKNMFRMKRFNEYCLLFQQEEKEFRDLVEQRFVELLQKYHKKTRELQFHTEDLISSARKSSVDLARVRDQWIEVNYPIKYITKKLRIHSQKEIELKAQLRVSNLILNQLKNENQELKQIVDRASLLIDSSESTVK